MVFAQQLPPEIWSAIMAFRLEESSAERITHQATLASVLRDMFLAAGPHLYRRPEVVDAGSFFLGMDRSFAELHHPDMTDDLCFEKGNTKLPLLRHVVTLCIVSPEAYNGEPLKTRSEHYASFHLAENTLARTAPHFRRDLDDPDFRVPLDTLLPLLYHIGEHPNKVCTSDGWDWVTNLTLAQWEGGALPASLVVHARKGANQPYRVAWGTHSHVYCDDLREAPAIRNVSSDWSAEEEAIRADMTTEWCINMA
ncbi:hypothetical protein IAT38_003937 [Cryptococcus sp. DSM 104549]